MLDVPTMAMGLSVWIAVIILHGIWRSLGDASPDPIRPPGPIFPS